MNTDYLIPSVKDCVRRANQMFNVKIPLKLSVKAVNDENLVASAWWSPRRPTAKRFGIRFNKFVVETHRDVVERIIIPHEVAHLVMHYKQQLESRLPDARDHGAEWAEFARKLGAAVCSQSTHVITFVPSMTRDTRYYKVTSRTKFVTHVGHTIYKRMLAGARYRIPQTREVVSKWNLCHTPIKQSQLISERQLCYIHRMIRV